MISYVFSSTKSEKRGCNKFCPEAGVGGGGGRVVQQTMYTHMRINVKTIILQLLEFTFLKEVLNFNKFDLQSSK
jgi:hypothetical protein